MPKTGSGICQKFDTPAAEKVKNMNELDYVMTIRMRMRKKLFRALEKRGRFKSAKDVKEFDSAWKERLRRDKQYAKPS